MACAILDAEKRTATVNDMIEWLWYDGFYRKEVGWSAEWDLDTALWPPDCYPEPYSPGMWTSSDEKADGQPQPTSNFDMNIDVGMDLGTNAGFREIAVGAAHEKYVRKMIKKHKKLLPEAIQEIDQRLLKTGVSMEEVQSLTSGKATDAYKKLSRLQKATGKCTPSTPLQFRIMSDLLPGDWMAVDIYLPRTYGLGDFEQSMLRHRLVMYLNQPTLNVDEPLHGSLLSAQVEPQFGVASQPLTKKPGCERKVWAYKIADRDKDDADKRNLEGWKALCDEEEFEVLMKALLKDELKVAKMAIVCHQTTLEKREENEKPKDTEGEGKPGFYTWGEDLDSSSDIGDNSNHNMEVDACTPFPDAFDWTQLIDETVAGWEEEHHLN
ncbi:hypothetical protein ACJ72_03245 [Emergomyces africanus]|uniref:Uncharacterized protein n=1 Tax=Emergomyces africanus TaxID=1955775 RepID=A0A1B7P060_9EURO|nr:hypothetical protein ACJ72_03245 [Emergomyces africanus]